MASFTVSQRNRLQAYRELAFGNPFLPDRIDIEKRLLGRRFVVSEAVWSWSASWQGFGRNLDALHADAEALVNRLAGKPMSREEFDLYADLVAYVLYYRSHAELLKLATNETPGEPTKVPAALWKRFQSGHAALFGRSKWAAPFDAPHLFAMCFQTRRAFVQVFTRIIGGSAASARLRSDVWYSVFTHDRRRHATHLVERMRDLTTLILGASGTGKELVATAVAHAQFRPFDPSACTFAPAGVFLPINLAAVPETLVESTLFGHKRGSFTGASADRKGVFENVDRRGCVFLDEIGEIPPSTQVKLLRVLQERNFQRVGDLRERQFEGKIIAATHRDLPAEIAAGAFRADLFYRLSGDLIQTPTLREQLADDPAELPKLVRFIAERVAGPEAADGLTEEVVTCIERDLGPDYPWSGNFRELEQCVRNVLVRRCYRPHVGNGQPDGDWLTAAAEGTLTAEQLLNYYVTAAYRRIGSYQGTAQALGLDRRTVKARVDAAE